MSMIPPGKPRSETLPTDAEIDARYGLEPAIGEPSAVDSVSGAEFVTVACPYCGERFETSVDASAGMCSYVEDCQVCCQPIEMELHVDQAGAFRELVARRGDDGAG